MIGKRLVGMPLVLSPLLAVVSIDARHCARSSCQNKRGSIVTHHTPHAHTHTTHHTPHTTHHTRPQPSLWRWLSRTKSSTGTSWASSCVNVMPHARPTTHNTSSTVRPQTVAVATPSPAATRTTRSAPTQTSCPLSKCRCSRERGHQAHLLR